MMVHCTTTIIGGTAEDSVVERESVHKNENSIKMANTITQASECNGQNSVHSSDTR